MEIATWDLPTELTVIVENIDVVEDQGSGGVEEDVGTGVSGDCDGTAEFGCGVKDVIEGDFFGHGLGETKGFGELETGGTDFDEVIHSVMWEIVK